MENKIDIDTKTFVRFWLVILGLGLVAAFIGQAKKGLLVVLLSAFLAVALTPLARKLDRIDRKHTRNSLSSVMAVVLIVVLVVGVISIIGPLLISEVTKFAGNAPNMVEELTRNIDFNALGKSIGINDLREQIVSTVNGWANGILSNIGNFAINGIGAVVDLVTSGVLVTVLTILFMLQGPDLLSELWKSVKKRRGEKVEKVWRRVVSRIAGVISKYISGQALVAVLDGVMTLFIIFLLTLVFDVPSALIIPLGLLAGVMYMIPMFGPVINCVIAALLLAFNSIWAATVYLVLYLIYEQLANNVIAPKIQGKGMGLSPLLILISITIGTYAFGIIGTFIAIPVAGCIKVLIEEYPNIKQLSE